MDDTTMFGSQIQYKNDVGVVEIPNLAPSNSVLTEQVQNSGFMSSAGVVSINNFTSLSQTVTGGYNQSVTTAEPNWTDINGGSLSIVVPRPTNILFLVDVSIFQGGLGGATSTDALIDINVDGTNLRFKKSNRMYSHFGTIYGGATTLSMHYIDSLASGSHMVKLQATLNRDQGTPTLSIYSSCFSYLLLGN
jgi:hypothetical protein